MKKFLNLRIKYLRRINYERRSRQRATLPRRNNIMDNINEEIEKLTKYWAQHKAFINEIVRGTPNKEYGIFYSTVEIYALELHKKLNDAMALIDHFIERLELPAERDKLWKAECSLDMASAYVDELMETVSQQQKQIEIYEAALKFYSSGKHFEIETITESKGQYTVCVNTEKGDKAKQALNDAANLGDK